MREDLTHAAPEQTREHGLLGLVALFARHRVAANLLMFLMILAGLWGLRKLNTQFFPDFDLDMVRITVIWPGASAEDVDDSLTVPIEDALRAVGGLERVYSTSMTGRANVIIDVDEDADTSKVVDEIKQQIDTLRNLPEDAETPVVTEVTRYDSIASLLVSGPGSLDELRTLVLDFEQQLYRAGIPRITFLGYGDEEIAIQIPPAVLHDLGMNLDQVASRIALQSRDIPAGIAARNEGGRLLRSQSQARSEEAFNDITLKAEEGSRVRLGDVAEIRRGLRDDEPTLTLNGRATIEMELWRGKSDDTLQSAAILNQWLEEIRPGLPQGVEVSVYRERWSYLKERIDLLLKNGFSGLVLVILVLFLFLDARIGFWVTVGIPVSFLTALAALWLVGGSINMISLFGLIMALGIIVDDAIVVGEEALSRYRQGYSGSEASIGAAWRMLAPVTAASLTTVAAFLPLFMIDGHMGNVIVDIPIVVICVIVASLIECFLILPGHLNHSYSRQNNKPPPFDAFRQWFDGYFTRFREGPFRSTVRWCIQNRWVTITTAFATFFIAINLVKTGVVKFSFFPSIDSSEVMVSAQFVAGTDPAEVDAFLNHLEERLVAWDASLESPLVEKVVQYHGRALFSEMGGYKEQGDGFGALRVAMRSSEDRTLSNPEFLAGWRDTVDVPPGVERLTFGQPRAGPPGKDIQLKIYGINDPAVLKQAAERIKSSLSQFSGVTEVSDDLPYGREQIIYSVSPVGEALGLTTQSLGRQIRAAMEGALVQVFYQNGEEIEVRAMLPDAHRNTWAGLANLPIFLEDGATLPLNDVVRLAYRQGNDSLTRIDGDLSIEVGASVNAPANANDIMAHLRTEVFPELTREYGVRFGMEGRSKDQASTMDDMKMGALIALLLIYVILAWVFSAYSWPLAVMMAIPFGLTGAILGHMLMGIDLTIMSMFGFFALSGIVINDSIVLLTFYRDLRHGGMAVMQAIEEACCQRLRAVLLTTLTTIGGLTPIMFESSLQAQFLIPMAVTLVFGLAVGTLLILLVVPSLLSLMETRHINREAAVAMET
jgi:multidrug efflux pump subunit AcrB